MKNKIVANKERIIRINTAIKGDPAEWLLGWKKRGLVLSNTDAIIQAFRVLHEKIVEQDLKTNRLQSVDNEWGNNQ